MTLAVDVCYMHIATSRLAATSSSLLQSLTSVHALSLPPLSPFPINCLASHSVPPPPVGYIHCAISLRYPLWAIRWTFDGLVFEHEPRIIFNPPLFMLSLSHFNIPVDQTSELHTLHHGEGRVYCSHHGCDGRRDGA